MIVFTPIKQIPVELLEYKGIRQVVSYNLSSYFSDVPTLNALIPSMEFIPEETLSGDCTTPIFDVSYHNFIMANNDAFCQFMNIIVPAYTSPDTMVQILIRNSPFCDAITESLLKFIQQRYGYNAYIVNQPEDFLYTDESDFSIPGLFALDQDLMRWRSMMPIQEEVDLYE